MCVCRLFGTEEERSWENGDTVMGDGGCCTSFAVPSFCVPGLGFFLLGWWEMCEDRGKGMLLLLEREGIGNGFVL